LSWKNLWMNLWIFLYFWIFLQDKLAAGDNQNFDEHFDRRKLWNTLLTGSNEYWTTIFRKWETGRTAKRLRTVHQMCRTVRTAIPNISHIWTNSPNTKRSVRKIWEASHCWNSKNCLALELFVQFARWELLRSSNNGLLVKFPIRARQGVDVLVILDRWVPPWVLIRTSKCWPIAFVRSELTSGIKPGVSRREHGTLKSRTTRVSKNPSIPYHRLDL